MSEPAVIRFLGHSGSGKTTLLERLIAVLNRRGLRVAVAKDTHHALKLDQPGKDSHRLAEAGASAVLLSGPNLLALLARTAERPVLAELANLVRGRADLLLAEGYRDDPGPAVLVWRAALARPLPHFKGWLLAVVSDDSIDLGVPTFSFESIEDLATFLMAASPVGESDSGGAQPGP